MGSDSQIKVGKFLLDNELISQEQLNEALSLQKDNPSRLIGEILVTMGVMSKEDMIMAIEMYLMMTDSSPGHVDEWLDQDEVDLLIEKINKKE